MFVMNKCGNYKNRATQYYDKISEKYADISRQRNSYLFAIERLVIEEISNSNDVTLLDVGTGDGVRLARIINSFNNIRAVAVEQSSTMVEIATRNLHGVRVLNADFASLTLAPASFSHITALWNVIGHVENRLSFLNAAKAALQSGGLLILDVNNRYNVNAYGLRNVAQNLYVTAKKSNTAGRYKLKFCDVETEVYIYSVGQLKADLKTAGFIVKNIIFVNYDNGQKEKCSLSGQIFCVAVKR